MILKIAIIIGIIIACPILCNIGFFIYLFVTGHYSRENREHRARWGADWPTLEYGDLREISPGNYELTGSIDHYWSCDNCGYGGPPGTTTCVHCGNCRSQYKTSGTVNGKRVEVWAWD